MSDIDLAFSQGETSFEEQELQVLSSKERKIVIRDHRELAKRGNFSVNATLKQQFTNEQGIKLENATIKIKDNTTNKTTEISELGTNLYTSTETTDNKEVSIVLVSEQSVPEKNQVTFCLVLPIVEDVGNYKGIIEWSLVSGK